MNLIILTNNPARASFRQRIGIYQNQLNVNSISYSVQKIPRQLVKRRPFYLQCRHYDTVFLHKKRVNPIEAMWLRKNARRIIYDFDDAVMYSDKCPNKKDRKRHNDFKRTVRLANLILAGNSYLANHARNFNKNVEIVPTGLDLSKFQMHRRESLDPVIRLVWIGSKSTLPYLNYIREILEQIGQSHKNVHLRLISDDFIDFRNIKVEQCKWSLETQESLLMTSDIGIAPLPDDHFTRGKCGFKILQYQAAGLPVVASPVGVNKDLIQENVSGFLASKEHDWLEVIRRLIGDASLRKRLGKKGQESVQKFDIQAIGKQLVNLISQTTLN